MNRWAPLFSKIVDSSLWAEDDVVVKVFLTMLAKKDSDHVVRGTAFNIGRWANKSEQEAIRALEVLSSPDTKRLEPQENEGRRIRKVDGGWLILNGAKYEEEMRRVSRQAYQAKWAREHRAGLKNGKPLPGELEHMKNVEQLGQEEAERRLP